MSLIMLIGPPAVGKMTIGQALEKRLGYKLFHNHVTIEMVAPYFSYGTPEGKHLVHTLRRAFFDAFAADQKGNYIFTYVWAFGAPGEQAYIEGLANRFAEQGHDIFWVELEADLETRLTRNRTENRLAHKPTKRNLEWSDQNVRESEVQHRMNSLSGEMPYENYIRINNTDLTAAEVAQQICSAFDL